MRIAIIEDSVIVRDKLTRMLSGESGLSVVGHAGSEDEACRLIVDTRPDLVLLDLSLSPGSGLNVLRRVRASKGLAPRVLVLTNQPVEPYEALCLSAGADGFFDKCGDMSALLAKIASWMPPQPVSESRRVHTLHELHILDTPDEESLDAITRLAASIADKPIALLSLIDSERQWFKARKGLTVHETSRSVSFCAHTILDNRMLEIEDAAADERFADNPLVRGEPNIRFYAGMPLIMPDGEVVGALCVADPQPGRLEETQRTAMQVLARSVVTELELRRRVIALETEVARRREAEIRIMHLATRDPLTGLPNRAALQDRLHQGLKAAARDGTQLGVIFLDVDRFKLVNDTLGHDIGDALLQEMAVRLSTVIRESDTVARLGGDEFAVILPALHSTGDAEKVAAKLVEALAEPIIVHGHAARASCSAGIAIYPAHGHNDGALLRHADLAMFHAKESGGNRFAVYSEHMSEAATERMTLESELRQAIDEDQLTLHFQPQIRLDDGALTGVEALVRWNHPRLGLLAPDRFIPLAEETSLIWPLGLKVLDMALAQCTRWRALGLDVPKVAVNVSPAQLRDELTDAIAAALDKHGLRPESLEIELTESALTSDGPQVIALLRDLQRTGVSIAVDDFGVGYSSLALLRRLPIDALKIDRSFVIELESNQQDRAIVEAILTMAQCIGLRTVAEGLERGTQHGALSRLGCEEAQGYFVARPLPGDQITTWMRSHAGSRRRTDAGPDKAPGD